VDLSLLEHGHGVYVLVAEDIGRKHEAHIVEVHFVVGLALNEALHEVDR